MACLTGVRGTPKRPVCWRGGRGVREARRSRPGQAWVDRGGVYATLQIFMGAPRGGWSSRRWVPAVILQQTHHTASAPVSTSQASH